jgi:hypothetical protein
MPEPKCTETRGYCECDKPDDGHNFHHCPECATRPNGGWAFATWRVNPLIRSVDRQHESMHEYANDPWAATPSPAQNPAETGDPR